MESESVKYDSIDAEELSFCLEDLGMIIVKTIIMACKTNPQLLEALIIATDYDESQA